MKVCEYYVVNVEQQICFAIPNSTLSSAVGLSMLSAWRDKTAGARLYFEPTLVHFHISRFYDHFGKFQCSKHAFVA